MFKNPITGRVYTFVECPPEEDGYLPPDPNITLAAIVICIGGPFYLIYKLIKGMIEGIVSVLRKIGQEMERMA